MAREFPDPITITVPLRTTWEELWRITDPDGEEIDLTGYELRMQVRDRDTNALMLTIGSEGSSAYASIEGPTGQISIAVQSDVVEALSPDNTKRRTRFDAELYIPGAPEYVIPLLKGSITFAQRITVLP